MSLFNLDPFCYNLETGELLSSEDAYQVIVNTLTEQSIPEEQIALISADSPLYEMVNAAHIILRSSEEGE